MKIMKVHLKNFKVFEEIEKELNGSSVLLVGDNSVGKSSLMQAIKIALGSKDIPSTLQDGAKGIVEVDMEGNPYTFYFEKKKGNVELKVTLPSGLKETKKGVIAGLVGAIDFDINEFVKMSDSVSGRKKQVEDFKKLLPAEFIQGINEFEKKLKNTFDERTELNNKIKTLKGFINESPLFGADLKTQPVDVEALNLELEAANKKNQLIKEKESAYEARCLSIEIRKKEIERLKLLIADEERKVHDEETINKLYTDWRKKNDLVDVSEMSKKLAEASEINVKASKAEDHNKKLKQLEEFEEQAGEMTALIETTRQAIADAIRDFDSPIPGLSFTEDCLVYNGVMVEESSLCTSEKMELGYKMAVAANPDLGLLFLENGESFGKQRFEDLLKFCEKNNIQVFLEQVERGKEELEIQFIS
jgi:predicted ATP-dependent endonuclease of OLD family